MAEQLTFDLPTRTALGQRDFFVSPANELALATVSDWINWPGGKLILVGPQGAGKTHLAHVWASETGAQMIAADALTRQDIAGIVRQNRHIAIEDADHIAGQRDAETALFHLHNLLLAEGGHLLVTATKSAAHWGLGLPDLASRMQAANVAALHAPDDALIAAILVKLFADRQLDVSPQLIAYLVARMQRSFAGAQALVDALDAASLTQKRAVTRKLAARVLDNLHSAGA